MPILDHILHPFKHSHKDPVGETPFGPLAARRAAESRAAKHGTTASSDLVTATSTGTTRSERTSTSALTTSSSTTSDTAMTPCDLSYPSDTGDDASLYRQSRHQHEGGVEVAEPLHNFHQTKRARVEESHGRHHRGSPPSELARERMEMERSSREVVAGVPDRDLIEFTPKGEAERTNFDLDDLRRGDFPRDQSILEVPRDQSILDVENTIPPSGMHELTDIPGEETEFRNGDKVTVALPGTEEQVIVKQVQGPEVTIHQTHIEQPHVHEQHIHKDIVHEHHIMQDVIHERHIDQPIIVEKHIEKPVVHEKHIERPIIHEKHYEKDVIHEKHIEQDVIHERHIDKPVVHEQHIVVPIIHEQHIIKPIIHEVHVTQVVTDLVLPTQTSQAQMSAAIEAAASAAIANAGNSTDPIHIMAPPMFRTADGSITETTTVLQTDATQPPPIASQLFEQNPPIVFPQNEIMTTEAAAAAVQAACSVPIGASATTVISRGTVGGVLPAPDEGAYEPLGSESSTPGLASPEEVAVAREEKRVKKDRKKKSKFHFFRKH